MLEEQTKWPANFAGHFHVNDVTIQKNFVTFFLFTKLIFA